MFKAKHQGGLCRPVRTGNVRAVGGERQLADDEMGISMWTSGYMGVDVVGQGRVNSQIVSGISIVH